MAAAVIAATLTGVAGVALGAGSFGGDQVGQDNGRGLLLPTNQRITPVGQRYLVDVLSNVQLAIQDGVDVHGYFHWTNLDNFEWARGYQVRFGLIDVDRKTLERTIKPSGRLYARIAQANALPHPG